MELALFITFCILISLVCAKYLMRVYHIGPYLEDNELDMPIDPETVVETSPASTPSLNLQMYAEAVKWLGKDVTPNDEVDDEVACAASLSTIIHEVIPNFPIVNSTAILASLLDKDPHFERVTEYEAGTVVVSPRIGPTLGHCGLFLQGDRIASNTSKTGLWEDNYSINSWLRVFKKGRGLHIYLWRARNNGV